MTAKSAFAGPIVLASDGSPDAKLAGIAAADMARRTDQPVHLVYASAVAPMSIHGAAFEEALRHRWHEAAGDIVARQVSALRRRGAKVAATHTPDARAADATLAVAARVKASLIVVGSRGLGGFQRILLGSVSEEIVHAAKCPVLVMRGGPRTWPPARVVVGDDMSEPSSRALALAVVVAGQVDVPITIVRALSPRLGADFSPGAVRVRKDADRTVRAKLTQRAAEVKRSSRVPVRVVVKVGDAAAVLADVAGTGSAPALVAVGTRGLVMVKRIALGSTSTKLVRAYRGPVLVCR